MADDCQRLVHQAFFRQWHVDELFAFISGVAASQSTKGQLYIRQTDSSTDMQLKEWAISLKGSYQSITRCIRELESESQSDASYGLVEILKFNTSAELWKSIMVLYFWALEDCPNTVLPFPSAAYCNTLRQVEVLLQPERSPGGQEAGMGPDSSISERLISQALIWLEQDFGLVFPFLFNGMPQSMSTLASKHHPASHRHLDNASSIMIQQPSTCTSSLSLSASPCDTLASQTEFHDTVPATLISALRIASDLTGTAKQPLWHQSASKPGPAAFLNLPHSSFANPEQLHKSPALIFQILAVLSIKKHIPSTAMPATKLTPSQASLLAAAVQKLEDLSAASTGSQLQTPTLFPPAAVIQQLLQGRESITSFDRAGSGLQRAYAPQQESTMQLAPLTAETNKTTTSHHCVQPRAATSQLSPLKSGAERKAGAAAAAAAAAHAALHAEPASASNVSSKQQQIKAHRAPGTPHKVYGRVLYHTYGTERQHRAYY